LAFEFWFISAVLMELGAPLPARCSHRTQTREPGTPLAAGRLSATFKEKTIAGDNSYEPGEIVKVSGIYSVVHDDGKNTFEVRRLG
jgi:hypothetical protein